MQPFPQPAKIFSTLNKKIFHFEQKDFPLKAKRFSNSKKSNSSLVSIKRICLLAGRWCLVWVTIFGSICHMTRSPGAHWVPTSSLRPFGPSNLFDFVLRALRPACDPCNPIEKRKRNLIFSHPISKREREPWNPFPQFREEKKKLGKRFSTSEKRKGFSFLNFREEKEKF